MTDKEKLEAIKAELHRLKEVRGVYKDIFNDIFAFINSLPEEPVNNSDWLLELQDKLDNAAPEQLEELWNKYHDEEEPVSDDLMRAVNDYVLNARWCYPRVMDETDKFIYNAFKAGAQWQKRKDIDKACEWLTANLANYFGHDSAYSYIEDFSKAMED